MLKRKGYLHKLLAIGLGVCTGTTAFADISQKERLEILEQKVDAISSATEEDSWVDRVSFNGFATVMAGQASNDTHYADFDDNISVDNGSLLALQWNFQLTDKAQAVAQLLARGSDDWKPEFEWAYLSYAFDNGINVKAGKYRLPLFMYSDYLDVGFAQPWIRPPTEVYDRVPGSSISGIDVRYDIEFDNSNLTIQPFVGTSDTIRDTFGLAATYTWEDWTFRAVYAHAKMGPDINGLFTDVYTPFGISVTDTKGTFAGIGVRYDSDLLVVAELTQISTDSVALYDDLAGYVTVGYNIGDFMPYVSYARLKTTDDDDRKNLANLVEAATLGAAFDARRTSYSVGVRYNLNSFMTLKADVTYSNDFDDTSGGYSANIAQKYDDVTVYSVALNAIF